MCHCWDALTLDAAQTVHAEDVGDDNRLVVVLVVLLLLLLLEEEEEKESRHES